MVGCVRGTCRDVIDLDEESEQGFLTVFKAFGTDPALQIPIGADQAVDHHAEVALASMELYFVQALTIAKS